jgi:hypothetical protein
MQYFGHGIHHVRRTFSNPLALVDCAKTAWMVKNRPSIQQSIYRNRYGSAVETKHLYLLNKRRDPIGLLTDRRKTRALHAGFHQLNG